MQFCPSFKKVKLRTQAIANVSSHHSYLHSVQISLTFSQVKLSYPYLKETNFFEHLSLQGPKQCISRGFIFTIVNSFSQICLSSHIFSAVFIIFNNLCGFILMSQFFKFFTRTYFHNVTKTQKN